MEFQPVSRADNVSPKIPIENNKIKEEDQKNLPESAPDHKSYAHNYVTAMAAKQKDFLGYKSLRS